MPMTFDFNPLVAALNDADIVDKKSVQKRVLESGAKEVLKTQQQIVKSTLYDKGALLNSLEVGRVKYTLKGAKINIGIGENYYEQCRYGFYKHYGHVIKWGKRTLGYFNGTFWMSDSFVQSRSAALREIEKEIADYFLSIGRKV